MSGDRPLVLPMSTEDRTTDVRARLFVAALVAPASLVLLSGPTTLRVTVGLGGLLVSAMYVGMARRGKRSEGDDRLTLDADGFSLHTPTIERSARWIDVDAFDVGDDASTLVVVVRDAEPIAIAPGYGGLGTVALHGLLLRHRDGAIRDERG